MKESTIQQNTIQYLSLVAVPFNFLFFSVPNESLMTALMMFKVPKKTAHTIVTFFKKMGLLSGVADIVIVHKGRVYFIEMKNETGEQSDAQKIFQALCERVGAPYAICRRVHDVERQLVEWGVVR